jgi:hypothetical protein
MFCITIRDAGELVTFHPCEFFNNLVSSKSYEYVVIIANPSLTRIQTIGLYDSVKLLLNEKKITHFINGAKLYLPKPDDDVICITLRIITRCYTKLIGKKSNSLNYMILTKNQEYNRESIWEAVDWHISYAIYKDMKTKPVKKSKCILM